jgi:hypothetical protein
LVAGKKATEVATTKLQLETTGHLRMSYFFCARSVV